MDRLVPESETLPPRVALGRRSTVRLVPDSGVLTVRFAPGRRSIHRAVPDNAAITSPATITSRGGMNRASSLKRIAILVQRQIFDHTSQRFDIFLGVAES